MSTSAVTRFDVWLKELLPNGVRYSKLIDAPTVQECIDEANRKGPGFYEVWNDSGSKMLILNVPGPGHIAA